MNDETRVILASIRAEIDRWKGRKLKFEGEEKQAEAKAIMSDVNNLLAPLLFRPSAVKANGYEAAKRGVYIASDWQAEEQKQSETAGLSVADLVGVLPKPPEPTQPIIRRR